MNECVVTFQVDNGANLLIPVPGEDAGGPGGVLVCAENFVLYRHQDHEEVSWPTFFAVICFYAFCMVHGVLVCVDEGWREF